MVDVLRPHTPVLGARSSASRTGVLGTRAAEELREIAYDLIGRPERDEVSSEERIRLAREVEDVVAEVLTGGGRSGEAGGRGTANRLASLLTPRLEALPLHLRVALANARRRQLLGFD